MKMRYWTLCGIPVGLIINHLLVGYYNFTANVALKLRPELLTLSWWEAFWSNHYFHWLWIKNPSLAYNLNGVCFILFGMLAMIYVGILFE